MNAIYVIAILSMVSVCRCQVNLFALRRTCPEIHVLQEVNHTKLAGQWYEISSTANPWEFGTCIQLYHNDIRPGLLAMHWEQIIEVEDTASSGDFDNVAIPRPLRKIKIYNDAESIGQYNVNDAGNISVLFTRPQISFPLPFWIYKTDYDSYYVAYSCSPYYPTDPNSLIPPGLLQAEVAWIMSRTRFLDTAKIQEIRDELFKMDIRTQRMRTINHDNCDELYRDGKGQTNPK